MAGTPSMSEVAHAPPGSPRRWRACSPSQKIAAFQSASTSYHGSESISAPELRAYSSASSRRVAKPGPAVTGDSSIGVRGLPSSDHVAVR